MNEPQQQVFENSTRYMGTNCITTDSQVATGCIGNIFDALRVFFKCLWVNEMTGHCDGCLTAVGECCGEIGECCGDIG